MKQRPEYFFQLWVARLFILFTKTARLRNMVFNATFKQGVDNVILLDLGGRKPNDNVF